MKLLIAVLISCSLLFPLIGCDQANSKKGALKNPKLDKTIIFDCPKTSESIYYYHDPINNVGIWIYSGSGDMRILPDRTHPR